MRVGTLAYATSQGLGILAKSFYDHGIITDVLVVKHSSRKTHMEWYPNSPITEIRPINVRLVEQFCTRVDAMLFFETPFHWPIIKYCRDRGIRTYLMPMHECMPAEIPYQPDKYICPSLLDYKCYKDFNAVHIPVPVETKFTLRTKANVFVHNAGHGGLRGRNGTEELVAALKYVESPIKLILRTQSKALPTITDPRVDVRVGEVPYNQLYDEGDVFVFPEKFNGLSLPLQEAYASGMLVMGVNRFPMDAWLPNAALIPQQGTRTARIGPPYRDFEESIIDPKMIAEKIDVWYGKDMESYSRMGWRWAQQMSWEKLKPLYLDALSS